MKNILKALLRRNELTPDPNDYIAVVSSAGKIDKSGLIDAVMEEGVEIKRETVEDIVSRYNRIAARYASRGWNVDTGLVYLHAIITGAFFGRKFDPAKNGVYVSVAQGIEIRKELADTEIEILGEMPDMITIYQVTNLQTKVADGTLTRGRNFEIEGSYIKIAGDDTSVGVYLESVDNGQAYKFEDEYISVNNPSKLLMLVPAELATGMYRLRVVTQYAASNHILKAPREAVYVQELEII
jgi:hypothetical protein